MEDSKTASEIHTVDLAVHNGNNYIVVGGVI